METITFENAKWAFIGFIANLALLGLLVRHIFTSTREEIEQLKREVDESREKHAETSAAVRVMESVCDERHR